ncbi:MAG: LiaF domain-containing protein [Aestuariibacter sp.]
MSVKLQDRPIEKVREEAIDKLIINYSHGEISAEAFERRLDAAMATSKHEELIELTADLAMEADPRYEASKRTQFTPNYGAAPKEEELQLKNVLSSNERSGQWVVPKKISLLNILGSFKLDFSDAVFHHQHVTIEVYTVLGNDEFYVPEDVNVTCNCIGFMSSVENTAPSIAHKQAPTITIIGKTILGSIEISIKRTIKEKFLAFADQIKAAFQTQNNNRY